jgi:hypothetical protein
VHIPSVSDAINVDITPAFEDAGVDFAGLSNLQVISRSWSDADGEVTFVDGAGTDQTVSEKKFEQLRSRCLGEFQQNIGIVTGELVYEAPCIGAAAKEWRTRFWTGVHIFNENRVGAPAPPTFQYATKFETDGNGYERRVGISHVLKPGEADRFNLKIGIDKSSLHKFSTKQIYNDGHELRSPRMELLAFVPRSGARYVDGRRSPVFSDEDT